MPSWPLSLPPAPLLDGFVKTVPETIIRTAMDQGPAKKLGRCACFPDVVLVDQSTDRRFRRFLSECH
jgi:hypothetical protein